LSAGETRCNPCHSLSDVIAQRGEQLAGKIVVEITNPLDFETFDSLVVPADSSATAEIAAALPQSRVVKAFNTTFAPRSPRPTSSPGPAASASSPDPLTGVPPL